MDRAELIEAIAEAIGDAEGDDNAYFNRKAAEAALRAIEEAGFVLVRKEEGK